MYRKQSAMEAMKTTGIEYELKLLVNKININSCPSPADSYDMKDTIFCHALRSNNFEACIEFIEGLDINASKNKIFSDLFALNKVDLSLCSLIAVICQLSVRSAAFLSISVVLHHEHLDPKLFAILPINNAIKFLAQIKSKELGSKILDAFQSIFSLGTLECTFETRSTLMVFKWYGSFLCLKKNHLFKKWLMISASLMGHFECLADLGCSLFIEADMRMKSSLLKFLNQFSNLRKLLSPFQAKKLIKYLCSLGRRRWTKNLVVLAVKLWDGGLISRILEHTVPDKLIQTTLEAIKDTKNEMEPLEFLIMFNQISLVTLRRLFFKIQPRRNPHSNDFFTCGFFSTNDLEVITLNPQLKISRIISSLIITQDELLVSNNNYGKKCILRQSKIYLENCKNHIKDMEHSEKCDFHDLLKVLETCINNIHAHSPSKQILKRWDQVTCKEVVGLTNLEVVKSIFSILETTSVLAGEPWFPTQRVTSLLKTFIKRADLNIPYETPVVSSFTQMINKSFEIFSHFDFEFLKYKFSAVRNRNYIYQNYIGLGRCTPHFLATCIIIPEFQSDLYATLLWHHDVVIFQVYFHIIRLSLTTLTKLECIRALCLFWTILSKSVTQTQVRHEILNAALFLSQSTYKFRPRWKAEGIDISVNEVVDISITCFLFIRKDSCNLIHSNQAFSREIGNYLIRVTDKKASMNYSTKLCSRWECTSKPTSQIVSDMFKGLKFA